MIWEQKGLNFRLRACKAHTLPLSYTPYGDKEIRTLDLTLAKRTLYQLSYIPKKIVDSKSNTTAEKRRYQLKK